MKRQRTVVLEQDQHLENLRKIIKRDFFNNDSQSNKDNKLDNISLDQYISNYTSHQNKFFSEMVHANRDQWKEKHWWMNKDNEQRMKMITQGQSNLYRNMLQGNREVNGINTAITNQQAENLIFFKKDKGYSSYLGQQHQTVQRIVYNNCSLGNQFRKIPPLPKYDEQDNGQVRTKIEENQSGKNEQANSRTVESIEPIMTWGQIQNTPLRLEGSQYRIPQTPIRDEILNKLNNKIKKTQKDKKDRKNDIMMKLMKSMTPSRNSSSYHKSSVRRSSQSVKRAQQKEKVDNIMKGLLDFTNK